MRGDDREKEKERGRKRALSTVTVDRECIAASIL